MAKLVNEHQDDWDEYLEEIAFSTRTQKQASTKYSSFFLMFGRHARSPMEVSKKLLEDVFFVIVLKFATFIKSYGQKLNMAINWTYHIGLFILLQ